MFRKFIKKIRALIKSLDPEELVTLGTSLGFLLLGFLIYVTWQSRLPTEETPDEEDIRQEEIEEESTQEADFENQLHGYKIVNIVEEIEEKERAELFGIRKGSDFTIHYKGVNHAVFYNENELSLSEWINEKINEQGPRETSLEIQKEFLNIVIIREKETPLGVGKEVIRINGYHSSDLFVIKNNNVLSFYYEANNANEVSLLEEKRRILLENID